MAKKQFDPTMKKLVEGHPDDWSRYVAALFHLPSGRGDVIDSDVSTVTAASDKVILVRGKRPWILHLEFVSGHNARLHWQILLYNVLLSERHGLPVHTVVVLLKPEANRARINGVVRLEGAAGETYLEFRYHVIRLWEISPEALLSAGLGLLPLAPVSAVPEEEVPAVINKMKRRIQAETTPEDASDLWTATFLLLGLNYSREFIKSLLQGIREMRESSFYQLILDEGKAEGKVEEARKILLSLGRPHLGEPDADSQAALEVMSDLNALEELIGRVSAANSWAELLPRRKTRKKRSS